MDISEKAFQEHIVNHLVNTGGYRQRNGNKSRNAAQYDIAHAVDYEMLVEFLTTTQPDTWAELQAQHGMGIREKFLKRLHRQIEQHGVLHVLKHGVKDHGSFFNLAYFRPASTLNPDHWQKYGQNILSVMPECQYSSKNGNRIDLVIFLNGLPLFTIELKNKLTGQDKINAIIQYQRDRDPAGEPLLAFKRCLAHFAVDGDEVYSTTRLQGKATRFLPFNRGNDGGAGNPINPAGYASSYFWERILQPESVLELVGSFIFIEVDEETQKETLIFPRYHQRQAVRRLLADVKATGTGKNYLVQHSAGSGKSKSIAWLAHRLSSLFDENNKRIFDSVVVITDRRVLDNQLQNAVRQLDIRTSDTKITGKVAVIDKDSRQLAAALEEGRTIVVTTLQKFPYVVDKIHQLSGQRFAIIADEAHSSQTGETSKELKRVLGIAHLKEVDDPETITGEELINASMKARGRHSNLSFFGFTATPKQKTLELFGIPNPKDPRGFSPFDEYTMRQAIEEGFILDVLQNYTTLKTYFNLLKTIEDDPNYPKSRAIRQLRNYVDMHSYTIEQKTAVMVTHFINSVQKRIPDKNGRGQAKAMVVTRSRKHAVRYKLAFNAYLAAHNLPFKALVAFSGEVEDGGKFTEAGMNGFSDTQTAMAFKKPEYRFLIVAEKFQTGFDEPLLHTMYIDKVLSGLAAVQTISRLNRIRENKSETLVLDFVNKAEHIQKAFQPYYKTTLLSEGTNPNKLYDLQYTLSEFDLYSDADAAIIAELFLREGEQAEKLQPFLKNIVTRFHYIADNARKEEFRKLLDSYIRLYAFLAQVMSFHDRELEELYLFGRMLRKSLPRAKESPQLNIQEHADLESYRIQKMFEGQIELEDEDGILEPMGDGLMGNGSDDEKLRLSEIIAELNARFGTEFDEGDKVFFAELKTRMVNQDSLRSSATNNSQAHVRLLFEALFPSVLQTMIENNFDLYKKITDESDFREEVIKFIFGEAYKEWERGSGA